MAFNAKLALLAVLEAEPADAECWNWPGWDHVHVGIEQNPVLLPMEGGRK